MATYGSAEWAQQMYGNNYYKPPAQTTKPPAQTYSQPYNSSYYQQYIEQMKAKQAAEAQAKQVAQTQADQAQAQQQAYERKLAAQQRATESQRIAEGQLGRQSLAYGQLGKEGESWFSRMFTSGMGLPTSPEFQRGGYLFAPTYGTTEWSQFMYGNRPVGSSFTPETPQQQEERLNILREQRRGYQVGMPGVDFVQNPQVLTNPSQNNNYGGYGYGGYPYLPYPSYSYGGGGYSPSQSASKWYNTMVQWNIGNK